MIYTNTFFCSTVNNVGTLITPRLFDKLTDDDIWTYVNVNVASVPAMTSLVLPGMLERKKGAIINISSEVAYFSLPYLQMYAATKVGLLCPCYLSL